MGWGRRKEKWDHVPKDKAKKYFDDFYYWHMIWYMWWKNYVYAEHVRFIAEITPAGTLYGRSRYRSTQEYADPEEIESQKWWFGYIAKPNRISGEIEIIADSNTVSDDKFRALYRKDGGTARW